MLDDKGFDLWADGYDKAVRLSDESNEYPFAAYKEVLNTVYKIASSVSLMKIFIRRGKWETQARWNKKR